MSKNTLSIFHLQDIGYSLTAFDILEEEIHLRLKPTSLASCPRCGQSSRRVHEKGRWRKVYHGYGFGRKVYLRLRKSRYFCSTCQRPFTKRLPLIPPWQRQTEGAEKQIIESLRGRSFKSVADKEGISYGVARRILMSSYGSIIPGFNFITSLSRQSKISRDAKKRLRWFDYYRKYGNARLTCRYFGISAQTFYRWKRHFDKYDLTTLEELSCRPHRVRMHQISSHVVERIRELREQYPRWGKDKLAVLIHREGIEISSF